MLSNCFDNNFWQIIPTNFGNPASNTLNLSVNGFVIRGFEYPWTLMKGKNIFWCALSGYLYFLYFQIMNEPGLGAGIGPGMGLTPFPSSIAGVASLFF